jgi:hypothetical protein
VDKTAAVDFNLKGYSDKSLQLTETFMSLSKSLIDLGMTIGNSVKETIKLAIQNLEKKTRIAYASLVFKVTHLSLFDLSKFYNSLTVPHLLALSPIWQLFPASKKNLFTGYILNLLNFFYICPLELVGLFVPKI